MNFLTHNPAVLLGFAALAFYLASRAGAVALDRFGSNPGGSAAAHWLPIACITLAFLKFDANASLHLIFASSVACLTIVLGATMVSIPVFHSTESATSATEQRAWPMVLAAAVLTFVAGFRASFTLTHALLFALQGLAAMLLWTPSRASVSDRSEMVSKWMLLFGWLIFSLVGGVIGMIAIRAFADRLSALGGGTIAGLLIAPAVALPMIGSALSRFGSEQQVVTIDPRRATISMCVGCVLLNLCLLLPLVIVVRHFSGDSNRELNFPISLWRMETVMLIALGAALVPMSAGRWKIGRFEGVLLLAGYAFYVSRSAMLAGQ